MFKRKPSEEEPPEATNVHVYWQSTTTPGHITEQPRVILGVIKAGAQDGSVVLITPRFDAEVAFVLDEERLGALQNALHCLYHDLRSEECSDIGHEERSQI